jgi:hypothetical protein
MRRPAHDFTNARHVDGFRAGSSFISIVRPFDAELIALTVALTYCERLT